MIAFMNKLKSFSTGPIRRSSSFSAGDEKGPIRFQLAKGIGEKRANFETALQFEKESWLSGNNALVLEIIYK